MTFLFVSCALRCGRQSSYPGMPFVPGRTRNLGVQVKNMPRSSTSWSNMEARKYLLKRTASAATQVITRVWNLKHGLAGTDKPCPALRAAEPRLFLRFRLGDAALSFSRTASIRLPITAVEWSGRERPSPWARVARSPLNGEEAAPSACYYLIERPDVHSGASSQCPQACYTESAFMSSPWVSDVR